jgi:multicomponent K+:H+ antiporter subunit F
MLIYALGFAFACFGLAILLNIIQMFRAPTTVDRILVLDTMTVNGIALIILYGVALKTAINFEAALLFAMTGFVSTVAFCKYLLRGSIIE